MSIRIIRVLFLLVPASSIILQCQDMPNIANYVDHQGDTINVNIQYDVIPSLKYDGNSPPYIVCLREVFARSLFKPEMHFEHSNLRKFYKKYLGAEIDKMTDEELKAHVAKLYKPLFPKGTKPSSAEVSEYNTHLLKKKLSVTFVYMLHEPNLVKLVDDDSFIWTLSKEEGKWKLYSYEKLD